ncbi:NAD(P)/FAD-dependent oxidoreductase [Micrococcoides hystricis]|uniref:NAD(P)/FAD-dependent oxidoreductase n=1 Tax=Micrococcoides hystricis TaxID=1572761 RepID=A0ABV6P8U7_9MICC
MASKLPGREVIVVGAGLVGLSTAFYLSRAGFSVTIIERDQVGSGASRGNAGEITPLTAVPLAGPGMMKETFKGVFTRDGTLTLSPARALKLATFGLGFIRSSTQARLTSGVDAMTQLGRGALAAFAEMQDEGIKVEGGGSGFLYTAEDASHVESYHKLLSERAADGVSEMPEPIVYGSELHQLEPVLDPACEAGFVAPGEIWIDPALLVESLGEYLRAQGVKILEGARVVGVHPGAQPSVDYVHSGARNELSADHVVVAAGAWASELLKPHGIHLGVVPGKGYSFTVAAEQLPTHLIHLTDARTVLVPMAGRLRVVGGMEFDGSYEAFHDDRIEMIERVTAPLVRGIDWSQKSELWVGPRPMTADGLPIIGEYAKLPNIVMATGHNMHGLSLGPITGKAIAAQLSGQPVVVADRHVDMERFAPARLRRLLS